jgi:hypothetical protein
VFQRFGRLRKGDNQRVTLSKHGLLALIATWAVDIRRADCRMRLLFG